MDELLQQSLEDLQSRAVEYGIDPYLPHGELIEEIAREVGIDVQGKEQEKASKKRLRRKKKREASVRAVEETSEVEEIEVDYVPEPMPEHDPLFGDFSQVFARFQPKEEEEEEAVVQEEAVPEPSDDDMDITDDEEEQQADHQPSKRRLRKLNRPSVAQLKQTVKRPDVVEVCIPSIITY
jgi:splicing factor 3B subunit 2